MNFNYTVFGQTRVVPSLIVALVFSLVFVAPQSARPQGTTATLGGIVVDPAGASIAEAEIKLTNTATGDTRQTTSNSSGAFSFSGVPSGDYQVRIEAKGFESYEQTDVHLDPGDQRTIRDIHLKLGTASESVTVTAATNQLNSDSGELSSTISAADIQHLAVEGRDVTELLKILPGMAIRNGTAAYNVNPENRSYDPSIVNFTGALGAYAGNGTPVNGTSLLTDGVDITDPGSYGIAIQNVNYDQVAEVKVQTGSFTADTARGPVVINAIGKSGGDKFHGALYTYARTSQLNSIDWIAGATGQGKPPDRQIYPGGSLGGPIRIPHTNFNRNNKLTFFVGAEEYAQRDIYAYGSASSATVSALVPTAGMRNGDFSQTQIEQYLGPFYQVPVAPGAACNVSIYNNLCNIPQTAPNGQPVVNGNIGPYMDAEAKLILNNMPLPNHTVTGTSSGDYNWVTTNLVNNNLYQVRGRVDYAVSDKNKLFASYSVERGKAYQPATQYGPNAQTTMGGLNSPGDGLESPLSSHVASANLTTVFGPTLTNELYVAGAYFSQVFNAREPAAYSKLPAIQASGNPYQGLYNNGSEALPSLTDYGTDGLPFLNLFDPTFGGIFTKKQIRMAGDNLSKLIGRHTLRAGVFYQYSSNPQASQQGTNGSITMYYLPANWVDPILGTVYNTDSNFPAGSTQVGTPGNYVADFAEGHVSGYSQSNIQVESNMYFWNFSGYIQDHWRVTPHLSVDLGIRLEHFTPWSDAHGVGFSIFDPQAYAAGTPSTSPGILYHKIDPTVPLTGVSGRAVWPEPRVGYSWDPFGRGTTMLRSGFGIYRQHDSFNDVNNALSTGLGQRSFNSPTFTSLATVHAYQSLASAPGAFTPDQNINGSLLKGDTQQPEVMTYNAAVDQQFNHGLTFEIAYAGNRSEHLLNSAFENVNALPAGALFSAQPNSRSDTAATAGMVYPFFTPSTNSPANTSLQNIDQAHIDSFKKYPLYNSVSAQQHNAYANYNGLQTVLNMQGAHGRLGVNYTWSKALGVVFGGDPTNYANDYNLLNLSRKHIFNVTYGVWTGELVKDRRLGILANGWELSGYAGFQSGANMPSLYGNNFGLGGTLTVPTGTTATLPGRSPSTCAANPCGVGVSPTLWIGTPDVNLQPALLGAPQGHGPHQYADPNSFGLPALGSNGSFHFGYMPAPPYFDADTSASKRFRLTEGSGIVFRFASFNVLNRPNTSFSGLASQEYTLLFNQTQTGADLGNIISGAKTSSTNFGTATYKTGRRIMEMSLRYEF
ncbi:Oar protein [Acidisarcina polymorpha]|uniref:Oar protein n=2 Tax=Acidisarcina polymorpha TaxID=2211140 RepID=A0A2Z5G0J6_9BACT|nr:Oar protein [Acidisarcina polymorpha]